VQNPVTQATNNWEPFLQPDTQNRKSIEIVEPFSRPPRTTTDMTAIDQQPRQMEEPTDLASLVERHQAGVWRYVRFLGADTTEADDLTQETFLALARAQFVERDERQTAGYLRVVARNQLMALRRRQNRDVSTVDLEAADSVWAAAAGPDGSLSSYLDALRDCVDQLEGRARQAVNLHYHDHAGREAIATQLGMQADGVKTLLRRTRDVLRECIERKINLFNHEDH
jgi:RNA polymerase sigma-70 factor (ECF subfamily)